MNAIARLSALICAATLASPAAARPLQFDLVCKGTAADQGDVFPKLTPKPFSMRMSVDLATGQFCMDECAVVLHLSSATRDALDYRYDVEVADKDHAAHRFRGPLTSTAGPFPIKDSISVDLRTGEFQRRYSYDQGDRASVFHDVSYEATCSTAPFSGLRKRETDTLGTLHPF